MPCETFTRVKPFISKLHISVTFALHLGTFSRRDILHTTVNMRSTNIVGRRPYLLVSISSCLQKPQQAERLSSTRGHMCRGLSRRITARVDSTSDLEQITQTVQLRRWRYIYESLKGSYKVIQVVQLIKVKKWNQLAFIHSSSCVTRSQYLRDKE